MAYFPASEHEPSELCRQKVIEADVFVLIAGFRYGSPVRDRPTQSYTEFEFETATSAGMPRLVFLLGDDTEGSREGGRAPVGQQHVEDRHGERSGCHHRPGEHR
jgi:hypothetical protein